MTANKSALMSEWVLTLGLGAVMFALIVIAKIQSSLLPSCDILQSVLVNVEILGAVRNPGIHSFNRGTPLKEFITRAKPLPRADLSEIDLDQPILEDVVVEIKIPVNFTVEILGALKHPGTYVVPIGTRVCDLKKFIVIHPDVDHKFLKSQNPF